MIILGSQTAECAVQAYPGIPAMATAEAPEREVIPDIHAIHSPACIQVSPRSIPCATY